MKRVVGMMLFSALTVSGCVSTGRNTVAVTAPAATRCDVNQARISVEADQRASPWGIDKHLEKNFPQHKVSWLMPEKAYQSFVIATSAKNFGRCNDSGCYLFAAPATVIHDAVQQSMVAGKHDPAALGRTLGLPAKNMEGPLRMMTLDLEATQVCARLPVDSDPGVWKCTTPEDKDCFKFGGYTSGGVPEVVVINAPVAQAQVQEVP